MYSSAASVLAGLLALAQGTSLKNDGPSPGLLRARQAIVRLGEPQTPNGIAALIDRSGWFIAHASLLKAKQLLGTTASGQRIAFEVMFVDEPTQLALLKTDYWMDRNAQPINVADTSSMNGKSVVAVFPEGEARAVFVRSDRVGVMKPALRYVPLSEIRFETQMQKVGGALLISEAGQLAGVLSATLEPLAKDQANQQSNQFGPQGLTVSYALGADILQRVVQGFKSADRRPQHPTIGAYFQDAEVPGALIMQVKAGSAAEKAGMHVGDIVTSVNGVSVDSGFGLAATLFRQRVGDTIRVGIKRGAESLVLSIQVGLLDSQPYSGIKSFSFN